MAAGVVWGGYVPLDRASGRFLSCLGSSYLPVFTALGGSKEAQEATVDQKSILVGVNNYIIVELHTKCEKM